MQTEIVQQRVPIQEITIRQATADDSSVLATVIREAFAGVARQFGLDAHNCPTRQWYLGLGFAPIRVDEYTYLPFKVEVMTKEVS